MPSTLLKIRYDRVHRCQDAARVSRRIQPYRECARWFLNETTVRLKIEGRHIHS